GPDGGESRCGRVGARSRVAGRRRNPAHVDRSRRHQTRIRLRSDGGSLCRSVDSGHRVGRRRHARSFRRGVHGGPRRRRARRVDLSLRGDERSRAETASARARHPGASVNPRMLIPSIDLKGGAVVQLVQGERLAIRDDDVFRWVRRFGRFPKVQVIDLDAAMGAGDNLALVRQIAGALRCRVGGGIRTVERAQEVLAAGAEQIIAGSALFRNGAPDLAFARALAEGVGRARVIAAVDSKGGRVVINGWKTALPLTAVDAVRALEPYCDEFLYTHVDTEGLMRGT